MKIKLYISKRNNMARRIISSGVFLFGAFALAACGGGGGGGAPTPASAGIVISKTTLSTSEDGTEDSFAVTLRKKPTSDVELTFESRDTTEALIGSDSDTDWEFNYFATGVDISFTPDNWNIPKIIRVRGETDSILDGNQTFSIANIWVWSFDLSYIGISQPTVSVTNIDTSASGVTVSASSLTTAENGSTSQYFSVKLNIAPTSTVTIPVTLGDASEGSLDSGSVLTTRILTFDTFNWSSLQYVYVYDVDDFIADGNQTYDITVGPATSSDVNYDGITANSVSVTNTDDDAAAFTVSSTALQTIEWGQNATFTVVLNTEPTVDVTIPVASLDASEGLISSDVVTIPAALLDLSFTPLNWQTPQTVTVNSVDETDQDGDISYSINLGVPSGATEYTVLPTQSISVVNVDDDIARINILGADLQTTEIAGADTFVISLAKAPVDTVVITVTTDDATEGLVKGGNSPTTALAAITLTFTTTDWQTPQTVTVIGQDDFEIDTNQIYTVSVATDTVLTLDTEYDVLSAQTVSVTNADNDVAGLTVANSVYATEGGSTDTFNIKLNTKPSADVVIPLTVEDQNEFLISGNALDYSATLNLTFTTANWSTAQTITVQAVDDFVDESTEYYDVTIGAVSSVDTNYDGLPATLKSVTISDNDTAGFVITPNVGLLTSENGTSANFTVSLTTEPVANVFVTIGSGNISEGLLTGGDSPSIQVDVVTLQFSAADWQSAQTVNIHGQDDLILDGPVAYNLAVNTITGTDSKYNSVLAKTVGVSNSDNEPTVFEGTTGVPVDLTAASSYSGQVDTTASYYVISGLAVDGIYDFSLSSVIDDVSLFVYSNSNFNAGLLCSSLITGTKADESCRATTASGTVYIKVDGALTENGSSYTLDAKPVYTIETFPNNGVTFDTVIELYHDSDLVNYIIRNDDSGVSAYSKIITGLVSGDTYYLKVIGFNSSSSVGSYSVWFTNTANTPSSTATPLDSDGEPVDDLALGATLLPAETVLDRTITSGDNDWFMFVVP